MKKRASRNIMITILKKRKRNLNFKQRSPIMKNPAASSGVSSVEKKKSCGLFSFYKGFATPGVCTPPSLAWKLNRPKAPPRKRALGY
jgi:hypothetical protein